MKNKAIIKVNISNVVQGNKNFISIPVSVAC